MADNTTIKNASGDTETISDDDISDGGVADGAKVQRVKIGHGADGGYSDVDTDHPLPVVAAAGGAQATVTAATDEDLPFLGPIDATGYAEGVLRVNTSDDFAGDPVTLWVGSRAGADDTDTYTHIWLDFTVDPGDSPATDNAINVAGSGVQEFTFPIRSRYLAMFAYPVANITAGTINVDLLLRNVAHPPSFTHVKIDDGVAITGFAGAVPTTPYTAFVSGDLAGVGQAVNLADSLVRTFRVEVTGTFVGTIDFTVPVMDLSTGAWVTSTDAPGSYVGVRNPGSDFLTTMSAYTSGTANVTINASSGLARVELTAPFVNGGPVDATNPLPVTSSATAGATPAVTSVAGATSDTELLAAAATRTWFGAYNDSASLLYLKLGTGASSTSYTVQVQPGAYFELAGYVGAVHGIWVTATGHALCTEVTP